MIQSPLSKEAKRATKEITCPCPETPTESMGTAVATSVSGMASVDEQKGAGRTVCDESKDGNVRTQRTRHHHDTEVENGNKKNRCRDSNAEPASNGTISHLDEKASSSSTRPSGSAR